MSNVYHTEPPTQGKVLIRTTFGDIDVELWSKEAPLACRNFIQLAMEGYFDNCEVHRIVKGFMVQMGDPTGTGAGGSSIWNKPFKDEVHGRIKFNHRGQVAMANSNIPNSNQSQFFITLDSCEWLNRKHTIFGKVTGNTMFNVLRMGEVETGEGDRPIDSIKIIGVDVLWNPFDDIVPRDTKMKKTGGSEAKAEVPTRKVIKATKDNTLLSFGAEEEEEEVFVKGKIHSSHDSKFKDRKLSSKVHEDLQNLPVRSAEARNSDRSGATQIADGTAQEEEEEDFEKAMKLAMVKKQQEYHKRKLAEVGLDGGQRASAAPHPAESIDDIVREATGNQRHIQAKSAEFLRIRSDLMKSRRAVNVLTGADAENFRTEAAAKDLMTPLEQRRAKYKKRKHEFGDRSDEVCLQSFYCAVDAKQTLQKLANFQESIRAKKKQGNSNEESAEVRQEAETYHGQVLELSEETNENLDNWCEGKLKFKKHIDDQYRNRQGQVGADGRLMDDYEVYDPRKLQ